MYTRVYCMAVCLFTTLHLVHGAPFGSQDPYSTAALSSTNCSSAALDGMLEIGCWGYKKCVGGVVITLKCPTNQVLERDSMTCVDVGSGHTDCSLAVSCLGRETGSYADWGDSCQTYVTCLGGVNVGRQYCPANLVFNETIQSCDYPYNVEPPCGTRRFRG